MDNFWKNKTVAVTGAFGFVGSRMCNTLSSLGANVYGFIKPANPFTFSPIDEMPGKYIWNYKRDSFSKSLTVIANNIIDFPLNDPNMMQAVLGNIGGNGVDIVIHLAAQAIVTKAGNTPYYTISNNISSTHGLLEACLNIGRNKNISVVLASTDKVYGNQPVLPYTEDMNLLGAGPYDASKVCCDVLARCYAQSGLNIGITRNANIYGPNDYNTSRIIPGTIISVLNGEMPVIRSDGKPMRDYLYIDDCINGYLLLAELLYDKSIKSGEAYNLSSNSPINVIDLYKKILSSCGKMDIEPRILSQAKTEIEKQWLNSDKIRKLGWKSEVGLDEGLSKTVEWIKEKL